MSKKSQVTLFIIVGLVIIISAIVFISFNNIKREEVIKETEKQVTDSIDPKEFENYVLSCIEKTSLTILDSMLKHGGTLKQLPLGTHAIAYNNEKFRYFCNYVDGKGCVNNLVFRKDMEQELDTELKPLLEECIDLNVFRDQGYTVDEGNMKVETVIAIDEVNIKLLFPIRIEKTDFKLELNEFSYSALVPLGKLFDLAVYITNTEITEEYFNKDKWMQEHNVEVKIHKHRPYPDIVYSLNKLVKTSGKNYTFNFGIHGKDTITDLGQIGDTTLLDFCQVDYDKNCYANSIKSVCESKGGTYTTDPICEGLTLFNKQECDNGQCKDCTEIGKTHGETWCVYDSIVGKGFDRTGTRHYKHSCIDGKIFVEECRDYREELCTADDEKAVCRINRWWDCIFQNDATDCMNDNLRDCYWLNSLDLGRRSKCFPEVPPGFKFWENNGQKFCNYANENRVVRQPTFRRIKAISMPNTWTDATAIYCFHLGDCGDYRNIVGERSIGNFFNTDNAVHSKTESEYLYLKKNVGNNYNIKLETDVNNKVTNLNYDPHPTIKEITDFLEDRYDSASSWSPCEAIKCNKFRIPKKPYYYYFKKWAAGSAFCSIWQAPPNGDCSFCSQDSLKPCTEYMCKSLGNNCYYDYNHESGIGTCSSVPSSELNKPLTVTFKQESLTSGYSSRREYFEWAGRLLSGYKITPRIKESSFSFEVETNKEAKCKMTLVPSQSYNSQSDFNIGTVTSVGTNHVIDLPVGSLIYDRLREIMQVSSFFQLSVAELEHFGLDGSLTELFPEDLRNTLNRLLLAADRRQYYYFIKCVDKYSVEDTQNMFITLSAKEIPQNLQLTVNLLRPDNSETKSSQQNISFIFKVDYQEPTSLFCSLYYGNSTIMNETWYQQESTWAVRNQLKTINSTLEKGEYLWNVRCTDYVNTAFGNENRTLRIT